MNGKCKICTLNGTKVDIKEEVGEESTFLLVKKEDELKAMKCNRYNPYDYLFFKYS